VVGALRRPASPRRCPVCRPGRVVVDPTWHIRRTTPNDLRSPARARHRQVARRTLFATRAAVDVRTRQSSRMNVTASRWRAAGCCRPLREQSTAQTGRQVWVPRAAELAGRWRCSYARARPSIACARTHEIGTRWQHLVHLCRQGPCRLLRAVIQSRLEHVASAHHDEAQPPHRIRRKADLAAVVCRRRNEHG
jgi:hypothetical protein